MDKDKKTLKSPLSAIWCDKECKAKIAGEAQRSIATEVLLHLDYAIMRSRDSQENQIEVERTLIELKNSLHKFLEKPK